MTATNELLDVIEKLRQSRERSVKARMRFIESLDRLANHLADVCSAGNGSKQEQPQGNV